MLSVAKSTKHPKEAAILVNFLLNDPQSVEALGLERGIPLNKGAETLLSEKGVIDPDDPVIAGLRQAQSLQTTVVATPYIEDLQVIDQFTAAREKLDQGKQTPAQVAADFRQQVERIVRRLNR
ncbi:putative ABC transporter substrate-binding protein YesO [compost metagenome]